MSYSSDFWWRLTFTHEKFHNIYESQKQEFELVGCDICALAWVFLALEQTTWKSAELDIALGKGRRSPGVQHAGGPNLNIYSENRV